MAPYGNTSVEVFADVHAEVGEGPHWDGGTATLLFVDLTQGEVYRYGENGEQLARFGVGQPVGAVIPRKRGGLVAAVRDGIVSLGDAGEQFCIEAPVEADVATNRMNDAKCDPAGRLLAGTTGFDFSAKAGSLYRIDADFSVQRLIKGLTLSNGMGWSPDGRSMYFIDSASQGVDVFGYEEGVVTAGRRVVDIDPREGTPDGMTVDRDGNIWVACFGSGAVRCFSPGGEQLQELRFPVSQVTSCTFGGPDLSELYVTSAAYRLDPYQLKNEPHAGATFVCRPGPTGMPQPCFAG